MRLEQSDSSISPTTITNKTFPRSFHPSAPRPAGWKEEKGMASHPSWKAGKTVEKKGAIQEFTGTKITFD